MPIDDTMTLEEIEATMAKLRARKQALKKGGKAAERKIGTLARRRERLMAKVQELDNQIVALRGEIAAVPEVAPRRRGRRPKVQQA
jgi:chromosome segregation ATPase